MGDGVLWGRLILVIADDPAVALDLETAFRRAVLERRLPFLIYETQLQKRSPPPREASSEDVVGALAFLLRPGGPGFGS
ncbi:MAG: hypothetical protein ACKVP3_19880 [Hyphomicrobiaceae bacterium]